MTKRTRAMTMALLLHASAAGAQEPSAVERSSFLSRLEWELRADAMYIENFFQAPEDAPSQDVLAGTGQLQATAPFDAGRGEAFLRGSATAYDQFAPGAAIATGGQWTTGAHRFQALGGVRFRNPRVEIGGEVGSADVAYAAASYSLRPIRAIEATVGGDFYAGRYADATDRNHEFLGGEGSLRYRGFGYGFMPEVGAGAGRLDARLESEDYDEASYWVSASSIPTPALYLSARFRHRARDYSTDDPLATSFGREDERNQVTVVGDLSVGGPWSVILYYSFEDADSTLDSRVFTTHLLITGLAYRFGG